MLDVLIKEITEYREDAALLEVMIPYLQDLLHCYGMKDKASKHLVETAVEELKKYLHIYYERVSDRKKENS